MAINSIVPQFSDFREDQFVLLGQSKRLLCSSIKESFYSDGVSKSVFMKKHRNDRGTIQRKIEEDKCLTEWWKSQIS